jgi:hypothetical protein
MVQLRQHLVILRRIGEAPNVAVTVVADRRDQLHEILGDRVEQSLGNDVTGEGLMRIGIVQLRLKL